MKNIVYGLSGILFGIILTKAEVVSWFRIQNMFLLKEPYMYLIIGSAVVVGMASVAALKKINIKSFDNQPLNFNGKRYDRGFIYGGLIFGVGWAITGACPGPIFSQIGAGEYPAIFTLVGAIAGSLLYSKSKSHLPH